jgi:ubiquinone/menaquinone biosynthesis C-methylase UbiE
MLKSDHDFVDSIPEIYDTYLVPLIFESYAEDLSARVANRKPKDVLEIASGSGVVSRALAPRLMSDTRYTISDLNQPMLDHAASLQGPDERITWRRADALDLPFDDDSFDSIACQFGVMFFPDRVAAYSEAKRVLRADGCFIFNVWDRIEVNEFAAVASRAVATVFPDDSPQFLARTPYAYHDEDMIREELGQAGFSSVSITAIEAASKAPSPRHPAIAFCQGTPLRNEIEARDASLLGTVTDKVAEAIAAEFGKEEVTGKIRGYVVEAEL